MRYIKKFNESKDLNKDYFPFTDEDISDLCLELTDINFILNIDRAFISEVKNSSGGIGKKSYSPLSKNIIPIYDITLDRPSEDISDNIGRFNGSLYYEEDSILRLFSSVINKLKRLLPNTKVFYFISNMEYNIRIFLPKVETDDIGFDWYDFQENLNGFISSLKDDDKIELIDIYKSDTIRITFKSVEYREDIELKIKSLGKKGGHWDNKEDYDELINKMNKFIEKYNKWVSLTFIFTKNKKYNFDEKGIFKKNIPISYDNYDIEFRIKRKLNL